MRDTLSRMSWLLDYVRTTLLAGVVQARAALDRHQGTWQAQLRSLRQREKRQALWREARPVLVFAVAYLAAWSYLFIAAFLGAMPPPTPLFVPGAVLFSALLLSPPRHWWRYLVAAFVIQVPILAYLHLPLLWNVVGYLPDAIEPIIAAGLMRRFTPLPPRFASLREVSVYTACVAVAVLVAATIGSAFNTGLGGEPFWTSWETWYLGDILAYLVLTPAILLWIAGGVGGLHPRSGRRFAEATLLYGGLLLMGVVVFYDRLLGPDTAHPVIYLPVPLLLWAAIRFGPRGVATGLSLIAILAITAVANALGPFASDSTPAAALLGNIFTLQLFLLVIGVPLIFLAALMQERTAAEKRLRASEAQYRTVVETQTELITRYRPDMTLTFVNDAACRFGGKSREELLGTSILADLPPEAATRVRAMVEGLLAQPDPGIVTIEHEALFQDGSLHWQQWVNRTVLDPDGQVSELQGIGRDITDRKLAEEQLRASEARYRTVVRTLPQSAVLLFDADLRHSFADGPGLLLVGLSPGEVEGRTLWEAFPDDLARMLALHYEAALSGRQVALDVAHAEHIFHVQAVPIPAAMTSAANSGAMAIPAQGGMIVLQDVTAQRRARDELERERLMTSMLGALSMEFRTLADHSPDAIGRLDPSGRLIYINQAAEELLGLTAEQWVGKTFAELDIGQGIYEGVYQPWVQALREVMETQAPRSFDAMARASDGRVRSLHTRFIPELAADGTLQSVLGIATDVSALKQAESRLAEQANELEAIFESQADGVGVYDLDGRVVRANRALRDLLGFDADASYTALPLEQRAERLRLYDEQGEPLPLTQWPQWRVLRGEILAGASAMEARVRTLDGRDLWISITGAPIRAPDGQATGVVLVTRDVTVRRALERQTAAQASELAAIFEAQADAVAVLDREGRMVRANRARQAMFQAFADLDDRSADPSFAAPSLAEQMERWQQTLLGGQYVLRDVDGHTIPLEQAPTYRALHGETLTGANAVDERFDAADGRVYMVSVSAAPIRDAAGSIAGAVSVSRDVTAQRELERQVREQASELAAIFEAQADVVVVYDREGRFVRGNRAWEDFVYRTAHRPGPSTLPAWINQQIHDVHGDPISVEDLPTVRALQGETVTGLAAVDEWFQLADGGDMLLSVSAAPMRDPAGHITGVVVVGRDVTARRQLERQVAEQERLFRTLVENSPDIIARFDRELRYLYVSPAIRQVSPLPEADYLGKTNAELGWPEPAYAPAQRAIERVFLTGQPQTLEEDGGTPDGNDPAAIRFFQARFLPERAADGQVESVLTVTSDITALKRTEQALRQSEERFAKAFYDSPIAIAIVSRARSWRILDANSAQSRLTGYRHEELVGATLAELRLLAPFSPSAYREGVRREGDMFEVPIRIRTKSGEMRSCLQSMRLISVGGEPCMIVTTRDVTERQQAEQALRAANVRLETARQQEERRTRIAESLRGVLSMLNSKRASREVLQYIVQQAEALLGSAATVIYGPGDLADSLPSEAGSPVGELAGTLRVQAAEGLRIGGRRPRPDQRLPFADLAVEQVLASAQPVALVDAHGQFPVDYGASDSDEAGADGDASIARLDGDLPAPYRALLVVPILVHDGLYGCLLLFYTKPHRFAAEEVALAQAYADQVALAITNAHLQVHLELEAVAAERNHLAQELHDTVKQELFSTSLIAQSLPTIWQTRRAEAEAGLRQLHELTQGAYAGLQALLLELRPAALEQLPLSETLRQLGAAMSTRAGVPIAVEVEGDAGPEPLLPTAVKVAFYRVAQEALMNAAKYARARAIRMQLRFQSKSRVELEIADDGRGFDPQSVPGGHFGLTIMHDRAHGVGASVQVQSHAGQGTVVVMTWRGGRDTIAPKPAKRAKYESVVGGGPS